MGTVTGAVPSPKFQVAVVKVTASLGFGSVTRPVNVRALPSTPARAGTEEFAVASTTRASVKSLPVAGAVGGPNVATFTSSTYQPSRLLNCPSTVSKSKRTQIGPR